MLKPWIITLLILGPFQALCTIPKGGGTDVSVGKTTTFQGRTIGIYRSSIGSDDWYIRINGTKHNCLGNTQAACALTAAQVAREGDGGHSH